MIAHKKRTGEEREHRALFPSQKDLSGEKEGGKFSFREKKKEENPP